VVEFSDFMCPYCRNLAGAFEGFLPQSGGRIILYFKNYPLDMECNPNLKQPVHVGSCLLARGGICAQEQGKFWPYHNRVFAQELRSVQRAEVLKMAGEAGLELTALEACMDSTRTRDRLAAEIAEAATTKLAATPTVFIDGKKLPRIQDFTATLDKEAKKRGLPPLPAPGR
jgi:protein-disulfide isomerase